MIQKKKIYVFILSIFTCLALMGCSFDKDSSEYTKVEIMPLTEGEAQGPAGNMEGTKQQGDSVEDGTMQEQAADGQMGGSSGDRINEQSFDVTLRPLGQVTFASYEPDTTENPLADVVFQIEQGGEVICKLS